MEVRNSCFAAFIDFFTPNTYVMVIMSDPTIREPLYTLKPRFSYCPLILLYAASAATLVNIRNARKHFEKIERLESGLPAPTAPRI